MEKYPDYFQKSWTEIMKRKIGLKVNNDINSKLVTDFLEILYTNNVDFTLAFRNLSYFLDKNSFNDKFLSFSKKKEKLKIGFMFGNLDLSKKKTIK